MHFCHTLEADTVRISTKLTLGLGLVSSLILGTYGFWQYAQERRDLTNTAERDFRTLAVAVQVAMENSLRDRQTADIREILDSLETGEPEIDVFVVDRDGTLTHSSSQAPSADADALVAELGAAARRVEANAQPIVRFEGPNGVGRLVGIYPLWRDAEHALGAIAIVRPLAALNDDLRRTLRSAITSSLTLIAGITFVGWLLLLVYVRRPLASVNAAMLAVRKGDLSATVPSRRNDELGRMMAEFNAMVRELDQARQQLLAAAESRELLEQALLHADKLITVGQLSAGLAHEIGSPLQILSGRARALAARADLPADVLRTARILDEQTARIAGIVEQLLSFARRKAPHMADIELGPPIGVIVDLLEGEARRRGVRLEYRCPAALPRVTADADQIQQIAMNLLSNALRATPRDGRVRVSLTESSFTTADGLYEQPSVALLVEDGGDGIPAELRGRIFEPFFTTWSDAGGTGLGLAVVKAIVDDHGGSIVLGADAAAGTRIVVHLPSSGRARVRGVVA
ncbi:MAG: ATP-binding protein [Deltaproteobacteria bacterium]|nr:ATP-binding protein [Deltaproteobacteria bacterium]